MIFGVLPEEQQDLIDGEELTDPERDAPKPKMQAIGACMRKLVMICYGVLKNRAPFDPAWASKKSG